MSTVHGLVSLYVAGRLHLGERDFRTLYARSVADLLRGLGWRVHGLRHGDGECL